MQITVDIPEQLAAGILRAGNDPAHVALEALAVKATVLRVCPKKKCG